MNTNTVSLRESQAAMGTVDLSLRNTARIAGVLYLIIIFAGMFAEFFVRSSLIVPGDAAATAGNITASEGLFRAGIASDMVMILTDVAIGLILYVLLRQVSHVLALLAAFFRLAQAATLGLNLLNLFFGLQLVTGTTYLAAFSLEQQYSLGLLFLNAHGIGYRLALVFFGMSLLILGYLVFKSGFLPKVLGVLLIIASVGYQVDSFAYFLLTNYSNYQAIFGTIVVMPAFIAELAFGLWLLVKGVRVQPKGNNTPETA